MSSADSQENRTKLLKAIGINPVAPRSSTATTKLDLPEVKRLIAEGVKVDGCRDRHGSTALGVAAQLGRIEAMKVLLEAGANIEGIAPGQNVATQTVMLGHAMRAKKKERIRPR